MSSFQLVRISDGVEAVCYQSKHLVGRKPHKCCECRREIPAGASHERVTGKWDGEWSTYRFCAECSEIGLTFACDGGRSFGTLWEAAEEFLFPSLGPDCFDKLITANAKQFLRDRWIAWKGLDVLEAQS